MTIPFAGNVSDPRNNLRPPRKKIRTSKRSSIATIILAAVLSVGLMTRAGAQPPTATMPNAPAETGIRFDTGQEKPELAKRLVVLIPGLLAGAESLQAVRSELHSHQITTATFHYPSDRGINSAAEVLSSNLQRLAQTHPASQVTLVTHSMGGIVARAVVETPTRFSENVTKLVMIAPPNHGSALAELSTASLHQTLLAKQPIPSETVRAVDQLLEQFLGQAKADLCPHSPLLQSLNSQPRNPKIQYAIYSGTGGPIPGEALSLSFLVGGFLFQDDPKQQESLEQIRKLATLPEWIRGSGDGVVSVQSTRLTGVECFETFAFAHNDFGAASSDAAQSVVKQLVRTLE